MKLLTSVMILFLLLCLLSVPAQAHDYEKVPQLLFFSSLLSDAHNALQMCLQ